MSSISFCYKLPDPHDLPISCWPCWVIKEIPWYALAWRNRKFLKMEHSSPQTFFLFSFFLCIFWQNLFLPLAFSPSCLLLSLKSYFSGRQGIFSTRSKTIEPSSFFPDTKHQSLYWSLLSSCGPNSLAKFLHFSLLNLICLIQIPDLKIWNFGTVLLIVMELVIHVMLFLLLERLEP